MRGGGLEPELPRKNVVGLFCGAAFHDLVFARVPGCDVVRLYDWEVRMRKLACLLPPALNRAKAQHACVLRPPERGGAGCQSLIKTPMTGTPSSTGLPGAPYA